MYFCSFMFSSFVFEMCTKYLYAQTLFLWMSNSQCFYRSLFYFPEQIKLCLLCTEIIVFCFEKKNHSLFTVIIYIYMYIYVEIRYYNFSNFCRLTFVRQRFINFSLRLHFSVIYTYVCMNIWIHKYVCNIFYLHFEIFSLEPKAFMHLMSSSFNETVSWQLSLEHNYNYTYLMHLASVSVNCSAVMATKPNDFSSKFHVKSFSHIIRHYIHTCMCLYMFVCESNIYTYTCIYMYIELYEQVYKT